MHYSAFYICQVCVCIGSDAEHTMLKGQRTRIPRTSNIISFMPLKFRPSFLPPAFIEFRLGQTHSAGWDLKVVQPRASPVLSTLSAWTSHPLPSSARKDTGGPLPHLSLLHLHFFFYSLLSNLNYNENIQSMRTCMLEECKSPNSARDIQPASNPLTPVKSTEDHLKLFHGIWSSRSAWQGKARASMRPEGSGPGAPTPSVWWNWAAGHCGCGEALPSHREPLVPTVSHTGVWEMLEQGGRGSAGQNPRGGGLGLRCGWSCLARPTRAHCSSSKNFKGSYSPEPLLKTKASKIYWRQTPDIKTYPFLIHLHVLFSAFLRLFMFLCLCDENPT